MLEMTIQVPEPLIDELVAAQDRMPEVLAHGLEQLSPLPSEIYRYILEFMVSQPSQDELIDFGPTESMQTRVSTLLEKNRTDELTAVESKELDEYIRINHLITMLKAHALPYLTREHE